MGWTPLHVAAFKGSDPIVRELLARGARPDVLDKEGRTALHLACLGGWQGAARDLLRGGAQPGVRDKHGASPYDYAIQKHPDIAALLGGPPPPAPAASAAPALPPGALPPVDLASSAPATQVLPPPPPAAPPVSTGIGGATFPPVHHDRTRADTALPPPPPQPPQPAPYPAGPQATVYGAGSYETASAPPLPYDYGYGGGTSAQPAVQQPSEPYGAPLAYPTVPGLRQQQQQQQQPPQQQQWPGPPQGYRPPPPQPAAAPPQPPARVSASAGEEDDDWAPAPRTDWGGEAEAPEPPQPHRPGFNPVASARFQLEKLLGAGLATLGLGQGAGSQGGGGARLAASTGSVASSSSASHGGGSGRVYGYEELYAATGGFSAVNKLGEGGFGPVYRGALDGIPVAVKVMDCSEGALQGRAEFEAEVNILSRLHHPHIVLLIGSCPDKGMLVYELMNNGSLESHVFGPGGRDAGGQLPPSGRGPSPLPWRDRVRIAAEVASALLFLHSAPTPIVHMDLKPANVLLDEHRTAKLGDVGLARLAPSLNVPCGPAGAAAAAAADAAARRSTARSAHLVGTYEYMDPEYIRSGEYSTKSDVYALGMVLLQMLTGQDGAQVVATVSAARAEPLGFAAVIDPRAGGWPAAEAAAFADLALRCVEYRRQDRPDLRTAILPTLQQLRQRTALYEERPAAQQAQAPAQGGWPDTVPPMFLCPITQDVMDDPVVAADGYTYERLAIGEWVARSATSPLTNMHLAHTQLTPNLTLRSAIREWREQQAQAAGRQQQAQQQQAAGRQQQQAPRVDSGGW